jgi:hypothetical protein
MKLTTTVYTVTAIMQWGYVEERYNTKREAQAACRDLLADDDLVFLERIDTEEVPV